MTKIHEVEYRGMHEGILKLVVDGTPHNIDLKNKSKKLNAATPDQRADFTISPSGYGINWPQIDEDLAIDPLIGIQHELPKWKVAEDFTEYITKEDKL